MVILNNSFFLWEENYSFSRGRDPSRRPRGSPVFFTTNIKKGLWNAVFVCVLERERACEQQLLLYKEIWGRLFKEAIDSMPPNFQSYLRFEFLNEHERGAFILRFIEYVAVRVDAVQFSIDRELFIAECNKVLAEEQAVWRLSHKGLIVVNSKCPYIRWRFRRWCRRIAG